MPALDVIEIPSADPITVALGGNNDIVVAQLHDDGRRAGVYFDVQHANAIAAAGQKLQRKVMRATSRSEAIAPNRPAVRLISKKNSR